MRFLTKLLISMVLITVCSQLGKRFPSLSGLIAVMPLTSLAILFLLYLDSAGDRDLMVNYTSGALFGIIPSVLFYLVAYMSLKKNFSAWSAVFLGLFVWLGAAAVHQIFFHR